MKIAFVGKGGSGKSTIAALFIDYLSKQQAPLIAIDADINIHLPSLLGVNVLPENAISSNTNLIKKFLQGKNKLISDYTKIVKTTPPTKQSNFLRFESQHPLLQKLATQFAPHSYLLYVGTYTTAGIGESCYHSDLAIFETLLAHTILDMDQYLIADMVAGTDAFAGTLHAQFDAIFLVVEPTPEGISVYQQYAKLAQAAGVFDYLFAIGNKIDDGNDLNYLQKNIGEKLIGTIDRLLPLKQARQNQEKIDSRQVPDFPALYKQAINLAKSNFAKQDQRLQILHALHKKHAQADYILARHGDLSAQIDPDFSYFKALTDTAK